MSDTKKSPETLIKEAGIRAETAEKALLGEQEAHAITTERLNQALEELGRKETEAEQGFPTFVEGTGKNRKVYQIKAKRFNLPASTAKKAGLEPGEFTAEDVQSNDTLQKLLVSIGAGFIELVKD